MESALTQADIKINGVVTIGVVADTHVPDRIRKLHPGLVPGLKEAKVDLIMHAGDICSPEVIRQLEEVAPVEAVRGNRDVLFIRELPLVKTFNVGKVRLALMHGHGGLKDYLVDKFYFFRDGYRFRRYVPRLTAFDPAVHVVIFGHTHHPEKVMYNDRLLFNPGSSGVGWGRRMPPSYGLLQIYSDGQIHSQINFLSGADLKNHEWIPRERTNPES